MPASRFLVIAVVLACWTARASAQFQPPAQNLTLTGSAAYTWSQTDTNIVLLEGPVHIDLDENQMTADNAVIWVAPMPGGLLQQQRVQIALLGDATLRQPSQQITRSGPRLLVSGTVEGNIRITAAQRIGRDRSDSPLYQQAMAMLPPPAAPSPEGPGWTTPTQMPWQIVQPQTPTGHEPTTKPSTVRSPVMFSARNAQTVQTPDDTVALVLSGDVRLWQRRPDGDFIEMQCGQAVLFTPLHSLGELQHAGPFKQIEDAIIGAYLQDDVRIGYNSQVLRNEQRLTAQRVYYDFSTDRAILTDAVLHTLDPDRRVPVILRAQVMRQLSVGEFTTDNMDLSTSAFQTPSFNVASKRAYIREVPDPEFGTKVDFVGNDVTLNVFGTPVFYTPVAAGEFTEHGSALRNIQMSNNNTFGFGLMTDWGLFESLGHLPPNGVDADVQAGYYSTRGPAGGLNAKYKGGLITETTSEPWNYEGEFHSFFVNDNGVDQLGGFRSKVDPGLSSRGRVLWDHQHFFPDDWQVQIRASYVSDPTFLEQWFPKEFHQDLPEDESFYVKHQTDTEAFTFLANDQPNHFVTTADSIMDNAEVDHVPEFGYRRIGDSILDDNLTFFSENTVSRLAFADSRSSLADLGFPAGYSPGRPAIGWTGTPTTPTDRADFRQEVDDPFTLGEFRFVPYVMGRYTYYSTSPKDVPQNRLLTGPGLRATTAFWKVDDSVESDLLDIHRLRHVIEPEINVFTSTENVHPNDLYIYDQGVDDAYDITAAQIALHQRWQTQRGGPGNWHSVDVVSWNVEGNFFANRPPDNELAPTAFRGLYFVDQPESSVPRNSINSDITWRLSDTTAILSDAEYNLDQMELATASIGIALQRDPRLTLFTGLRYIQQLRSDILSVGASYELNTKYSLLISQSYDFGQQQDVTSGFGIIRKFDALYAEVEVYYDAISHNSGFRFDIYPLGLTPAGDTYGGLEDVFTH